MSNIVLKLIQTLSLFTIFFGEAVLFGQTQTPRPGEIKVAYDQQSDTTRVALNPMIILSRKHEELRLGVVSSSKGRAVVKPKEVAVVFISLSLTGADRYDGLRKLTITADRERFPLGETQRTTQSQNGIFAETMTAVVPYETFSQIAYAKKIAVKLGLTEVELSPDQIKTLRAALGYMAP